MSRQYCVLGAHMKFPHFICLFNLLHIFTFSHMLFIQTHTHTHMPFAYFANIVFECVCVVHKQIKNVKID